MNHITIDEEFKALIPPLSEEERDLLEGSIIADGCRDALVLWDGVLIDGHHRYEICTRLGIEFDTVAVISIETRQAAMDWIDRNQLGRRNLTPDQMSLIRGRMYNRTKRQDGGHGDQKSGHQNEVPNVAERLASEHGVSRATIERDAQFSNAVEKLGIEAKVTSGNTPAPRKEIIKTARYLPEDATAEDIKEAVAKMSKPHVLISQSKSNEWYTPSTYVDAARRVMGGIDCDPASNETAQAWINAEEYFTIETDGLAHEWHGCVWLNPPWGKLTGGFISKLDEEIKAGHVSDAVVLVNAHATDTKWFTPLWDGLLCFTDHRIDYHSEETKDTGSTHGSVFVYFGANRELFIAEFSKWGAIVERAE